MEMCTFLREPYLGYDVIAIPTRGGRQRPGWQRSLGMEETNPDIVICGAGASASASVPVPEAVISYRDQPKPHNMSFNKLANWVEL